MSIYAEKAQKNDTKSVADNHSKQRHNHISAYHFQDNRPEAVAQRKLQDAVNASSRGQQLIIQCKHKGWTWDGSRWIPDSGSAHPQPPYQAGAVGARCVTDEPETVEDLKIECTDTPLSISDYNRGRTYAAQAFNFQGHPAHSSNNVHKHPKSRLQEMSDAGATIPQLREVMRLWGR